MGAHVSTTDTEHTFAAALSTEGMTLEHHGKQIPTEEPVRCRGALSASLSVTSTLLPYIVTVGPIAVGIFWKVACIVFAHAKYGKNGLSFKVNDNIEIPGKDFVRFGKFLINLLRQFLGQSANEDTTLANDNQPTVMSTETVAEMMKVAERLKALGDSVPAEVYNRLVSEAMDEVLAAA